MSHSCRAQIFTSRDFTVFPHKHFACTHSPWILMSWQNSSGRLIKMLNSNADFFEKKSHHAHFNSIIRFLLTFRKTECAEVFDSQFCKRRCQIQGRILKARLAGKMWKVTKGRVWWWHTIRGSENTVICNNILTWELHKRNILIKFSKIVNLKNGQSAPPE